ncbi:protein neprosin-like [Silene latifolia]|uniref:protein neprosin-like n=1 Tax=Silene latifolia TaxID=37657 RepID=UPI003D77BE47
MDMGNRDERVNQYYHKEAFQRKQEAECNIDSGTSPQPEKWRGHGPELAGIKVHGTGMRSVRAKLAIYQSTDVDIGEYSSSIVSVEAGSDLAYTLIQAGWTVNPCLYNDNKVHFFMYQFVDSRFCLDGGCKEFVVQNSGLKFGDVLTPSEVGYDPQTFLEIYIAQDQTSGDWYLNANSKRIGYWQSGNTTFESLKEGGTIVLQWELA